MLTLTYPAETPLHPVPAGVKVLALCGYTAVLFGAESVPMLMLAVLPLAGLALLCGAEFVRHWARTLWPLWPFLAVLALWHGWTRDVSGGAVIGARMILAFGAANLVTMTTRLADMLAVVQAVCAPLARLGVPPRRVALVLALTIRFIPVLGDRMHQITQAYIARARRRPGWRIVIPATLAALDDADHVAEALRARGGA